MSFFLVASLLLVVCFLTQGLATLLFVYKKGRVIQIIVLGLTGLMGAVGIAFYAVEIFSNQVEQYQRLALMGIYGLAVIGFLVPYLARTFNKK